MITNLPNHSAPMFVSQPTYAVSPTMINGTIYMPSSIAARVLGNAERETGNREGQRGATTERATNEERGD
jgi:hypothetical protein